MRVKESRSCKNSCYGGARPKRAWAANRLYKSKLSVTLWEIFLEAFFNCFLQKKTQKELVKIIYCGGLGSFLDSISSGNNSNVIVGCVAGVVIVGIVAGAAWKYFSSPAIKNEIVFDPELEIYKEIIPVSREVAARILVAHSKVKDLHGDLDPEILVHYYVKATRRVLASRGIPFTDDPDIFTRPVIIKEAVAAGGSWENFSTKVFWPVMDCAFIAAAVGATLVVVGLLLVSLARILKLYDYTRDENKPIFKAKWLASGYCLILVFTILIKRLFF